MTVTNIGRTNYGADYPDVNYRGLAITRGPFVGLPGVISPGGFSGLGDMNILEYGVIGIAAWWLYKKYGHKIGL